MSSVCDVLVIGAGFFGLYLAEFLAKRFPRVMICERGAEPMRRASYHNQARVHHGYHYPRSLLTAQRSAVNFPRFVAEFGPAVDSSFDKLYAIARQGSKTSAEQFYQVFRRIGAPIEIAKPHHARWFDAVTVEQVFLTKEFAFNADALRKIMLARIAKAGVELRLNTEVAGVRSFGDNGLQVELNSPSGTDRISIGQVFCCAYAQTNQPGRAADIEVVPLKHELTEMALVQVPSEVQGLGVTVMDGAFFSCMPFPARKLHSLSHVRFTPHFHWYDQPQGPALGYAVLDRYEKVSAFPGMMRDAAKYMPALAKCEYRDSLWEVKTVLPRSESDDSRPILLRLHHGGVRNYHLVMGGKIDNVYDVVEVLEQSSDWNPA
jgi:glycine/D-amino acid oxidase-like deaminating enzyme